MAATIHLTQDHVVFEGELGALRPHSHGTLALLFGLDAPFLVTTSQGTEQVRVASVPASVRHSLDFFGKRALVIYAEPHAQGYAGLHRMAAGSCLVQRELDEQWGAALDVWRQHQTPAPLVALAHQRFGDLTQTLDARVRRVATHFSQGQLLQAETEALAHAVALSVSRLTHLFTAELGAGIRRVKQYYRFKIASAAIARGESLTTAAHAAGFADSAHFSRAFANTFGLAPMSVLLKSTWGLEFALEMNPSASPAQD